MSKVLKVNGKNYRFDGPGDMPLLWALRDILGLTGTKFGCGQGLCGACTVQLDGMPARSCQTYVEDVEGLEIRTIEATDEDLLQVLRNAWAAESVAQCGYCQAGQLMSASALLKMNSNPTDEDIDAAMAGNICRCGTYGRIRKAIRTTVTKMQTPG